MCGRFTLHSSGEVVAEAFNLPTVPSLQPRFNITPSQPVAVVRYETNQGGRELVFLRWGLIPAWADDPSIGQCSVGDGGEQTFLSQRLSVKALSGCLRWILRMAEGKRAETALPYPVAG